MQKEKAQSIDFAALNVLKLVHDNQSFSVAADKLSTNQSTISYNIDRLRKAFEDPLFVRRHGGVVPTDRCREIVVGANAILDRYRSLIEPARFEPSEAEAAMTISCNYYERQTIVPTLVRRLRTLAPGIRLEVIQSSTEGKHQLNRDECDLLVSPMTIEDTDFYRRQLFEDHYVCVMDRDNPMAERRLDLAAYTSAPHALVTYGGNWRSFYLRELEGMQMSLNNVLKIPSPGNLQNLLLGTDLISTIPKRIAAMLPKEFVVLPCPCPAPFGINLYWTLRQHHSPMHIWLRQLVAKITSEV